MGPPRQQPQHPSRVVIVGGFGEDLPLDDYCRVGSKNDPIGLLVMDGPGFVDSHSAYVCGRVLTVVPAFVDMGRVDVKGEARSAEQFRASRRGGGEDNRSRKRQG